MALDTATRKADLLPDGALEKRAFWRARFAWLRGGGERRHWVRFSLTRRVLSVNFLAMAFLGGGMLYLDRYEDGLIDTELGALQTQGEIFAAALDQGAVFPDLNGPFLVSSLAQGMARRMTELTKTEARVFLPNGSLIADSQMRPVAGKIQMQDLSAASEPTGIVKMIVDGLSNLLRASENYPPAVQTGPMKIDELPEVLVALNGHVSRQVRVRHDGGLVLSVAVPVRDYKRVLGALHLTVGGEGLEQQVNAIRSSILRLFVLGLIIIILLSLYLAGTIVRPLRHLAQAAHDVRHGDGRKVAIPNFSARGDEIGELSVALADMTSALWRRMDAIERFAADVAHEIKNPLTSLRSAVETAARVTDHDQQRRLMAIILDDVQRLDRLISDISGASRLDAEMSRLEREPVSLAGMLAMLVDMASATRGEHEPNIIFLRSVTIMADDPLIVLGKETRLVQVFQNVLANAVSFSPTDSRIVVTVSREDGDLITDIDDQGPGIPETKLGAIFDRFYSERPQSEKFGMHSGLGLSISKQIIEAHGGQITASNLTDGLGRVIGARFRLRLPESRA